MSTNAKLLAHPNLQTFGRFCAGVYRNKETGMRYLRTNAHAHPIPLDIARLGAGRDAWLRQVVVKCSSCDTKLPIGETEADCLCPKCLDECDRENEALNS